MPGCSGVISKSGADATFHAIAFLNVYNAFSLALYSIITRKISGVVAAETMQFWMTSTNEQPLWPLARAKMVGRRFWSRSMPLPEKLPGSWMLLAGRPLGIEEFLLVDPSSGPSTANC